jgi:hypothetical protein
LLVKQVFERYASGEVTLDNLRHFLAENGVRAKKGKLVGRTFVSDMLKNPIHYGHFCYAGEVYEGKHEAIISKDLFDRAQAVLFGRWRYSPSERKTEPKAFLGLLHCSTCGGAITAEIQKGHTYYRPECQRRNNGHTWCVKIAWPVGQRQSIRNQIARLRRCDAHETRMNIE